MGTYTSGHLPHLLEPDGCDYFLAVLLYLLSGSLCIVLSHLLIDWFFMQSYAG